MRALHWASTVVVLLLAGCSGRGGSQPASGTGTSTGTGYSVSASVSGLTGIGLTLTANGSTTPVNANGSISLVSGLQSGAPYAVAISTQPVNPVQTCALTNESGSISNTNVSVAVSCTAASASTINAAKATITLDSSVPASAYSTINAVVSPLDSEPFGTPLYVPISASGGETVVLAVDSNQNIILAAMTGTNSANLSTTSTALALVRLTLGALPSQAVASQLDAAIENTAEFPNLVSKVSAALASNTPPGNSAAVYSSIGTIAAQLPQPVVTAIQTEAHTAVHAEGVPGPVANPSVTTPLPFTLMSISSGIPQKVAVTDATQAGDVQVSNSTLIAWALASAKTSGQNICPLGIPASSSNLDCSTIIGQTGITQLLVYNITGKNSDLSTGTIPGNSGGSFNLTLEQSIGSRSANVVQIVRDSIQTYVFISSGGASSDYPALGGCVTSIVDTVLPSSTIGSLVSQSWQAALNSIKASLTAENLVKTLDTCLGVKGLPDGNNSSSWTFSQAFLTFALSYASSATTALVGLPGEIGETASNWSFGKTPFGVCEVQKPAGSGYILSNCAQSFAFAPMAVTVAPGTSFISGAGARAVGTGVPNLSAYLGAFGSGGNTLLPPDLVYSSPQDTSVIDLDDSTGAVQVHLLPSGQTTSSAMVTVTEDSTGISANYTIDVNSVPTVTATASPADLTSSGGSSTLSITMSPPAGAIAGSPAPAGTITFVSVSNSGDTFCPQQQPLTIVQWGTVTCTVTTSSAPDFITVNYRNDPIYAPTSKDVAIGLISGGQDMWTWVGGAGPSDLPAIDSAGTKRNGWPGVYGTEGVASSNNAPGSRESAVTWTDRDGNFWLFGGLGYDSLGPPSHRLNDFWKYSPSAGTWTWIGGSADSYISSSHDGASGSYGVQGTPSVANMPGSREQATSWTDLDGNFWLFGGYGFDSSGQKGELNDMWVYRPAQGTWTWIAGSNSSYPQQSDASPISLSSPMAWTGIDGDLWLLGYHVETSGDTVLTRNELWRFRPSSGSWTRVRGTLSASRAGTYGVMGVPSASNAPGARVAGVTWTDSVGDLWLFGGGGGDSTPDGEGSLNDLWRYDPASDMWTWMGGSNLASSAGIYGVRGVPSASNIPGGRAYGTAAADHDGNVWIFGGQSWTGDPLNDLWRFDSKSGTWTWVAGSNIPGINSPGVYGAKGVASTENSPGHGWNFVSWADLQGNFWLFGGVGFSPIVSNSVLLNDLWRFAP